MSGADFLDSNVVIYAYDLRDPRKYQIARELLRQAIKGEGIISVQVLGEVATAQLHKLSPAMSGRAVLEILDLLAPVRTISPDRGTVRRAVQACIEYGIHFYDGMIVAAAEQAGCARIWSEDLNTGQEYFGIRVENPFG